MIKGKSGFKRRQIGTRYNFHGHCTFMGLPIQRGLQAAVCALLYSLSHKVLQWGDRGATWCVPPWAGRLMHKKLARTRRTRGGGRRQTKKRFYADVSALTMV
jgi:hypothetical protein